MDILEDYREWVLQQEDRIGTHSDDCHMWPRHEKCMIHRLAREVERLRNGAPTPRETVQCPRGGDCPAPENAANRDILTAEEREAIKVCESDYSDNDMDAGCWQIAATLRSLLERL